MYALTSFAVVSPSIVHYMGLSPRRTNTNSAHVAKGRHSTRHGDILIMGPTVSFLYWRHFTVSPTTDNSYCRVIGVTGNSGLPWWRVFFDTVFLVAGNSLFFA